MKKRVFALLLAALLLAGLLGGCTAYDDLMYGLYTALGGEAAGDATAPSEIPPPASEPAASSAPESERAPVADSAPDAEPEPEAVPIFNAELLAMLGATNAELIALLGEGGLSYIMYGGSAIADYTGRDVALPVAFWLDGEQEEMLDVYFSYTESGEAIEGNIWPGHFPIGIIEAYGDALGVMFPSGQPSYEDLCTHFGQQPELYFTAANEGMDYSYPHDTWECGFTGDGLFYDIIFYAYGGEKVPYIVRIFEDR